MSDYMRHRIQVTCPLCGKEFSLEIEVGTYVTAESTAPSRRRGAPLVLRGREAKTDFIFKAMRAQASKDPSGSVERSEILELAEKVGLSAEEVDTILKEEVVAGHIYEAKPGIFRFTASPERARE